MSASSRCCGGNPTWNRGMSSSPNSWNRAAASTSADDDLRPRPELIAATVATVDCLWIDEPVLVVDQELHSPLQEIADNIGERLWTVTLDVVCGVVGVLQRGVAHMPAQHSTADRIADTLVAPEQQEG